MRVNTKKTMCPHCQKLVIGRVQKADETIKVSCTHCSEQMWFWNGINWHQVRK